MKKNLLLLALLAFAAVSFTACGGDDDADVTPVNVPTQPFNDDAIRLSFVKETIDYKRHDSKDGYVIRELELTESGHYFVKLEKKAEDDVTRATTAEYAYVFGFYTKDAQGNYVLNGFGTITITMTGNSSATVSITLQDASGASVSVSVTVSTPPADATSEATKALCRNWKIQSTRVQIQGESGFYQEEGCNVNSLFEYIKSHAKLTDVLPENHKIESIEFSKNGTFALMYANGNIDKATWRWVNASEGALSYTWDFADMGYSFVDGTASVKIIPEGTSQLKLYGTAVNDKKEKKNVTITVNML